MWFTLLDSFRNHRLYAYVREALSTFRRPDHCPVDYVGLTKYNPKPKKTSLVVLHLTQGDNTSIKYRTRSRRIISLTVNCRYYALTLTFARAGPLVSVRCYSAGKPCGEHIVVNGSTIDYMQYDASGVKHGVHCRTTDSRRPDLWIQSKFTSRAIAPDLTTMYAENGRIVSIKKFVNGNIIMCRNGGVTYVSTEYDEKGRMIRNTDQRNMTIKVVKHSDGSLTQHRTYEAPTMHNGWTAKVSVTYSEGEHSVYALIYADGKPIRIEDYVRDETVPVDAECRRHGRSTPTSYGNIKTVREWSHGEVVTESVIVGGVLNTRTDWLDYDTVRVLTYYNNELTHIGHYLGDRRTKHGSHITNPQFKSLQPKKEDVWDHGRHLYTRWLDIDDNVTAIAPPGGNPIGTIHTYNAGKLYRSDIRNNGTITVLTYEDGVIRSKSVVDGNTKTYHVYTERAVTRERQYGNRAVEYTTLTPAGKVLNHVRNIVTAKPNYYKGYVESLSRWVSVIVHYNRDIDIVYDNGRQLIQCCVLTDRKTTTVNVRSVHNNVIREQHLNIRVPEAEGLYDVIAEPLSVLVSLELVRFVRAVDDLGFW